MERRLRTFAAVGALAVIAVAGASTAVLVTSGDSAVDSYATCEQAVTELLLANRIVAPSQSYRKDNPAEYLKVRAYLDGGTRPTGSLTHMGTGLVALEDTCRALAPVTTTTGTTTTTTTTEPPPPPTGSVHVWLSPGGSDTSCVRNDPARPCLTLNRAYQVAQPGDVVEIAGGTYSVSPDITYDSTKTSSDDVVFRPAPGATVVFSQHFKIKASHLTMDGSTGAGGKMKLYALEIWSDSADAIAGNRATDITLKHIDARGGQSGVMTSDQVTISDVDIGGHCGGHGEDALIVADNFDAAYYPTNLLIEDSRIGDICHVGSEHNDCAAISGVDHMIFRRNKVWYCGTQGFYTKNDYGSPINDILVENNQFGSCATPGQGGCYYSLWIDDGTNIVIRYNSFAVGVDGTMNVDAVGPVSAYGNAGQLDGCSTGVTYAYNVWTAAKCSATDITANPLFVKNTGGDFDLHLTAGSPAIGRGDPTRFPATDFDGQLRTSPPDAGADER